MVAGHLSAATVEDDKGQIVGILYQSGKMVDSENPSRFPEPTHTIALTLSFGNEQPVVVGHLKVTDDLQYIQDTLKSELVYRIIEYLIITALLAAALFWVIWVRVIQPIYRLSGAPETGSQFGDKPISAHPLSWINWMSSH